MAVEKTKHEFVDDNPYLVYSGEPDTSADNAGGGDSGGDDSPFLYVNVEEELGTWSNETTLTISENKTTIVNAMRAGKEVIFIVNQAMMDSTIEQHYIRADVISQNDSFVSATFIIAVPTSILYRILVKDNGATGTQVKTL